MATSIVGIVVLLGGLIFFHELGHYLVAKLFGVRVEVFSLGFGKKIFRRRVGETEYCLSLIPLGGYVKLMGDDPYRGVPAHEADRAFSTQKLYKRFLIVAVGPIANFLLAIVLFVAIFWVGQPMRGTRIGVVVAGSPAWTAGLRAGDKLRAIGEEPVVYWNDLEKHLEGRVGEPVELSVERSGTRLSIPMTVGEVARRNVYGEEIRAGGLPGISPYPLQAMIGVSDPQSVAGKAGLRTGDLITKVDNRGIVLWEELREAVTEAWAPNRSLTITVKRGEKSAAQEKSLTLVLPGTPLPSTTSSLGVLEILGIFPSELFVYKVTPKSPAERGGLQPGDRIAKVGDAPIYHFESIVDRVQDAGVASLVFALEREGQTVLLDLRPEETDQEDPLTRETKKRRMVGFMPQTALAEGETVDFRIREPIALFTHAIGETVRLSQHMVVSLFKLVTGSVSVKNLGGPVLIASIAGQSLEQGTVYFLRTMALISINLFLLNLFPIPVLDGGHLFFFTLEAIKGKPVSIRTMEIANQIGLVLILMLVALTFFNDISRIVQN